MSLHEEVDALRRVPLFSKIEPSKLKLLAFTSEKLEYSGGQDLCTQGDTGAIRKRELRGGGGRDSEVTDSSIGRGTKHGITSGMSKIS